MLADAAKHAFDALIVWKTDRIGRNKEEIALNKYHLKKNGVKIYYVAEAIPDTPEGIILEAVIEGMAAYYSEQLSQNVRRGMRMCAQKAQSTGGTHPLGYTVDENKKFVIDPKHAPTVQEIYQLYSEGKTISEIVKHLNDKGLRTARGRPFTHNSLRTVLKNKKYIGTFEYNGEVSIENAVPPIVDVETFNKVQELLAFNQKAGAHKKAKVEYLLFSKIFCGKCGDMMVGICGTSKAGVTHHYYACRAQRKHQCNKRAVRQDWIEGIVLRHLTRLVKNTDLLEFIAENTYQYYLAQNTDTTYTKSLQKALDETERAINNLLRAIEAGIFNESTKDRMDELQEQKSDLKSALAAAKLKEDLGLKKEHILFFLHQFTNMDYSDIDCQRRLIKTFLNSVFVYDDKVVLTFNYSGDDRTITLHEIDGGLGHSICIPSCVVHQKEKPSAYAEGFSFCRFLRNRKGDTSAHTGVESDFKFRESSGLIRLAAGFVDAFQGTSISNLLDLLHGENPLAAIGAQKKVEQQFAEFLESLLAERGNRLVVFVDELDRCNPSFAVKLLERIKHYFFNDRITFVFSVNINELQHTIKKHYGTDFDACRYLDRFFDFRLSLPPVDMDAYFRNAGLAHGHYVYDGICKSLIDMYGFTFRESTKFLQTAFAAAYKPTHGEKTRFMFSDGHGMFFCIAAIVPLMIALRIKDYTKYNNFVSGKDSSPLHELFEFSNSVGRLKGDLLADGETYKAFGEADSSSVVSLKKKLGQVYDAVFKNPYTDGRYECAIGKCSFSKSTRDWVLRISSAMSEYADFTV